MTSAISGPDLFDWAKFVATLAAPFIALAGGVWLFFLKSAQGRADELRKERLVLYRRYLQTIEQEAGPKNEDPLFDRLQLFHKLAPLHDEVSLMAPNEVVIKSREMLSAVFDEGFMTFAYGPRKDFQSGTISSTDLLKSGWEIFEEFRTARKELLTAMREDIVRGAGIDPSLTVIEDQKR